MIAGIWSAVLTPVDDALSPDQSRAVPYYRELLASGCDGINLLGTTGEAMSLSIEQRVTFMEACSASDLAMDRMMVGTGAASLRDAIKLTKTAFDCGFAAALIMPPFFFRDASDDGIVAFFDELLSAANPPPKRVLLYNFPRMSGIAFHPALVDRLLAEFGNVLAGMKDSSNDPQLQTQIAEAHANFAIFTGSESNLLAAAQRGVAGCISGSVALWPHLAQRVFGERDPVQERLLTRRRAALDGKPFIAAVRSLVARQRNDAAWERSLPPLQPLSPEESRALTRQCEGG